MLLIIIYFIYIIYIKVLLNKNFPLIFHGVEGQDLREENNPSFFNP